MLKNIKSNQRGFTLVELLIVIVVIAILAVISIVAYNGIQDRARNSAAEESANQLRTKVTAWQGIEGSYPAVTDVTGGLTNTDVPEAKLDTSLAGMVTTTTPTQAKPLQYKLCTSDGAQVIYWQKAGNKTFNIGDTTTC